MICWTSRRWDSASRDARSLGSKRAGPARLLGGVRGALLQAVIVGDIAPPQTGSVALQRACTHSVLVGSASGRHLDVEAPGHRLDSRMPSLVHGSKVSWFPGRDRP